MRQRVEPLKQGLSAAEVVARGEANREPASCGRRNTFPFVLQSGPVLGVAFRSLDKQYLWAYLTLHTQQIANFIFS